MTPPAPGPTLADLASIMLPVVICAGVGYAWTRLGRSFDFDAMARLVTDVSAPCLVFFTLATLTISASEFANMVGATAAAAGLTLVVGLPLLRAARLSIRAFLPTLVFPNTGNMGLPLCLLAFGETGLALAIAVFAVYSVTQLTVGAAISSGSVSLSRLARIPLLWALPPALVFLFTNTRPPQWLLSTTELLGNLAIPLMLVMLGTSLARLRVAGIRLSLTLAVGRLAMGFAAGYLCAVLFGLSDPARGVLLVQSTMPVAVFNYLFAARYNTAPEQVAGAVVVSTVMSFVTLPLLLWYLL